MRGRKRHQKKCMKKMFIGDGYTFYDLMIDSKKTFEEFIRSIRLKNK
jgi:hypothetical protein